jgi:integrase
LLATWTALCRVFPDLRRKRSRIASVPFWRMPMASAPLGCDLQERGSRDRRTILTQVARASTSAEQNAQALKRLTQPIGNWKEAWEAAKKRAGRALNPEAEKPESLRCRFHDLRHTGCTRMLEAGVPFHGLGCLNRHKNVKNLRAYWQFGPARCSGENGECHNLRR